MVVVHKNTISKEAISVNYQEQLGSWHLPLMQLLTSSYMTDLMNFVNQKYIKSNGSIHGSVFPQNQDDVFKAFKLCNYNTLKVVIIGYKPYANIKSNGLAFGNKKDTVLYISPNLDNICKCVKNTIYSGRTHVTIDTTLEDWAEDGVLLLNTALTTSIGEDHNLYWRNFTREVLKTINEKNDDILFMFLDNTCDYFKKYISLTKHKLLENNHVTLNENSDIFTKADEYLYNHTGQIIKW